RGPDRGSSTAAKTENQWHGGGPGCEDGMAGSVRGGVSVVTAIVPCGPAIVHLRGSAAGEALRHSVSSRPLRVRSGVSRRPGTRDAGARAPLRPSGSLRPRRGSDLVPHPLERPEGEVVLAGALHPVRPLDRPLALHP